MLEIISESQSAFVLGRQIFDNVLIAYELIHFLRHKQIGKRGYMSINLDMSKAKIGSSEPIWRRCCMLFASNRNSLISSCFACTLLNVGKWSVERDD